jgi:hypothetical protein
MSSAAAPLTGTSPESELFDRALIDLDVDKKARDAGVKDQPPPNSVGPDANERQFIAYFSDKLRDRRKRCEGTLSKFALHRSATSSKIDISQTRSSLVSTFNAIEPDLARKRQDHQQDLESTKDHEARSLRFLRYFQQEHGLQDRAADPRPSPIGHFALVAVLAIVEWVALSIAYAEGSDFGLLGGILIAMALSLINIGLAVFTGAILRYVNHKSLSRKVLASLAAALLTFLFLFATGFAAHYRNAVRELAASGQNQQQSTSQAIPDPGSQGPLGLTAGAEDDQWKASKLAWEQFREHGFIFTDVPSWLLVIPAILFGIVASWKGYGIDDRYPGYGSTWRRYEAYRVAYEAEKKKYTEAVDGVFLKARHDQQELLHNIRRDIEYFQDLATKSENEANDYAQFTQHIAQTCNDVVFRYRDLNRQVATSPAPGYFSNPVHLDAAPIEASPPLTGKEYPLLAEYTAAIREFTDLVEKDDAQCQALRTAHLGRLDEFFERIERAMNEKLAREAQLYKAS